MSVHWNPLHPLMFVSADSIGNVKVWDLFKDFDNGKWNCNIGKCCFDAKWDFDGRNLGLANENGDIIIKRFKKEFFEY